MENIAIHTPTQEDFNKLMERLEEEGKKWIYGNKPTERNSYWDEYREKTCVYIDGDCIVGSGSKEDYEYNGDKIITVEEYLNEWKQGDILVNDRKGYKRKILGICGEVYFVSGIDDFIGTDTFYYNKKELGNMGYKLKGEKDTIEIKVEGKTKTISKQSAKELNLI